jgi:antitoxin YefM
MADSDSLNDKRGSTASVAEDDQRAAQETLYLVLIPGFRESILDGMQTPVEECETALDW